MTGDAKDILRTYFSTDRVRTTYTLNMKQSNSWSFSYTKCHYIPQTKLSHPTLFLTDTARSQFLRV